MAETTASEAKTEVKAPAKAAKVNESGQTEGQFKEAHGGRSSEEVNPPPGEPDEAHQEAKKKARWG